VLWLGLRSCVLSEGLETAVEGGRLEVLVWREAD
jgi:hypothetical protein